MTSTPLCMESAAKPELQRHQMSSIADSIVECWLSEIRALKPSKRPKWKGIMHNQKGCASVVRYVPDGLSLGGQTTYFAQKLDQERQAKRNTSEAWIPVFSFTARTAMHKEISASGRHVCVCTPEGARHILEHDPMIKYRGEGTFVARDQGEMCAQVDEQIRTNATGNHTTRNHRISVPTAPGQPVRG